MNYTIYKTTNLINGKFYIGMHKTPKPNDSYLGSGTAIKKAIEKYGRENFSKEILFCFDNEQEMIEKEKEIVNETLINDNMCYNMTLGGIGSWSHIDSSGKNNPNYGKELWKKGKSQEEIIEINRKRASKGEKNGMYGKTHSDEAKQKIIEANKAWLATPEGIESTKRSADALSKRMKGKPKSEEQRRKMAEAAKKRFENMPILECPHCKKTGKGHQFKNFHFEKCKSKI